MKTCYSTLNNSRELHYFRTYIEISPAGISVKVTPEAILTWIEATQLTLDPDVIKFITVISGNDIFSYFWLFAGKKAIDISSVNK